RYVWGDAAIRTGPLNPVGSAESGTLDRYAGLAGLSVRASQKLSFNVDYEGAATNHAYFTTSLYDYQKMRARARYQVSASLSVQANFSLLNNQNPAQGIRLDYQSRGNSLALYWTPAGGKRFSIMGEYDRSTLRSDINYLGLFFAPAIDSYRERAHTATGAVEL